jgi:two-component system sensor histidine kinase KdpD
MRYLGSALLVAVATAAPLTLGADAAGSGLILLVAVIVSSLLGRGPGLFAAVTAAASYSYFFIPPTYAFSLGKGDDLIALVTFVIAAFVVGTLVSQVNDVREARMAGELSQTRAAFFAAAGHNLRTPLASVTTSVDALLSPTATLDDAERRELLETVRDETDRLSRLVSKVLELSRIRSGELDVRREAVDLPGLTQSAVRRLGPLADGHAFDLDLPDDLEVELDALLTEQILLNTLENAAKFSPPGAPISVVARAVDDAVELRIIDHGPGIPPEDRERVFDEFYRGGDRRATAGTGLGLAIVKALTEAQRGAAHLEVTDGGGTTLVLTFPRAHHERRASASL